MVSEKICFEVLTMLDCRTITYERPLGILDEHGQPSKQKWTDEKSMPYDHLYMILCDQYEIPAIDLALRWLRYNEMIVERYPFDNPLAKPYPKLARMGQSFVDKGGFSIYIKPQFYPQQDPYAVFLARQFREDDEHLVAYIRDDVLTPFGLTLVDGKEDGLGMFRSSILAKIRKSRYFIGLLTRRDALQSGEWTTSTWIYAETGIATAFDKQPLLLVEEGIGSHYIGEISKVYEYTMFNPRNFATVFKTIRSRIKNDLELNNIPLPTPKA